MKISLKYCHKIFIIVYVFSCCIYSGKYGTFNLVRIVQHGINIRCTLGVIVPEFIVSIMVAVLLYAFVPFFLLSLIIRCKIFKMIWSIIWLLMFVPVHCFLDVHLPIDLKYTCPLQCFIRILYALFLSFVAIFHYKRIED